MVVDENKPLTALPLPLGTPNRFDDDEIALLNENVDVVDGTAAVGNADVVDPNRTAVSFAGCVGWPNVNIEEAAAGATLSPVFDGSGLPNLNGVTVAGCDIAAFIWVTDAVVVAGFDMPNENVGVGAATLSTGSEAVILLLLPNRNGLVGAVNAALLSVDVADIGVIVLLDLPNSDTGAADVAALLLSIAVTTGVVVVAPVKLPNESVDGVEDLSIGLPNESVDGVEDLSIGLPNEKVGGGCCDFSIVVERGLNTILSVVDTATGIGAGSAGANVDDCGTFNENGSTAGGGTDTSIETGLVILLPVVVVTDGGANGHFIVITGGGTVTSICDGVVSLLVEDENNEVN